MAEAEDEEEGGDFKSVSVYDVVLLCLIQDEDKLLQLDDKSGTIPDFVLWTVNANVEKLYALQYLRNMPFLFSSSRCSNITWAPMNNAPMAPSKHTMPV